MFKIKIECETDNEQVYNELMEKISGILRHNYDYQNENYHVNGHFSPTEK